MTIYGESGDQFRPGPKKAALLFFCVAVTLIGAVLATLLTSAAGLAVAFFSSQPPPYVLHAPFAGDPHIIELVRSAASAPLIVFAALSGLSLLIAQFWPTDQTLSMRLFVLTFASLLITVGAVPLALDAERFGASASAFGLPAMMISFVAVAICLLATLRIEKKLVETLANLYSMESPSQRLRVWALRMPLPFSTLAVLAWLNDYRPLAWSAAGTIVVTLLENISRPLRQGYERLDRPELREAAATTPIVMLLLLAGSIYLFGMRAFGLEPRAVVLQPDVGVRIVPLSKVARGSSNLRKDGKPGEEVEPKIQMEWSKKKKKKP